MTETVTIPGRFNGPPSSANGGYVCGVVAGLVGAEEVGVSLRAPPPLEQPLEIVRDGDRVELRAGNAVVADGAPEPLLLDVPEAISPDEAASASAAGRERWTANHPFPSCVVCGPDRDGHDGLRIFPGELRGGEYAADWTPDRSTGGADGLVRPECVWAALDCPTSAPVATYGEGPPMVLARLTARLACPVRVGEPHALLAWALELEGRKRQAAGALFDSEGRLLCASRALWIEVRSAGAWSPRSSGT
jgi:hypothetical protein